MQQTQTMTLGEPVGLVDFAAISRWLKTTKISDFGASYRVCNENTRAKRRKDKCFILSFWI